MSTKAIKFTYEDYLHLPDDGKRYQVIDGEVYMVPAPVPFHQIVLSNVGEILRNFVRQRGLGIVFFGPCDIVLSEENVVQPHIFFISKERQEIITEKNIWGAPDLIVEISSPYTEKIDRTLKRDLYARFGVKEYWIIDPDKRTVDLLALREDGYQEEGTYDISESFTSPILLGLVVRVSDIFAK